MEQVEHIETSKDIEKQTGNYKDMAKSGIIQGYDKTKEKVKQTLNALDLRKETEESNEQQNTALPEGEEEVEQNPNKLNQHELDEYLMSNYPIISPGKCYSFKRDGFFQPCHTDVVNQLDADSWSYWFYYNLWYPLWSPRSFQFQLTKLTHALGLGPSLYLMQIKYFGICFLLMSLLGFIPYAVIKPGALHFGAYAEKFES